MMGGWLARLKNEKANDTQATKPTKPPQGDEKAGFVGFVAYPPAPFEKNEGCEVPTEPQAKNLTKPDPEPTTAGKGLVRVPTDPANAEAPAATPGTLATVDGTDLHTWPHSPAMNAREVDTFTARLVRFTDKGVTLDEAERLADVLVTRDREGDDRALCLECTHLQGWGRWRCGNWQVADVARVGLVPDLVTMLQRCGGYVAAGGKGATCQMISVNFFSGSGDDGRIWQRAQVGQDHHRGHATAGRANASA